MLMSDGLHLSTHAEKRLRYEKLSERPLVKLLWRGELEKKISFILRNPSEEHNHMSISATWKRM